MPVHPTYISLEVPEPVAADIAHLRFVLDPAFAHLPVEIAMAGSSGLGVLAQSMRIKNAVSVMDRLAQGFFPIAAGFTRAAWLEDLRVHALEVDATPPLLALHAALRDSGLTFAHDAVPDFHPHCTLRWTDEWMTPRQQRAWSVIAAPREEFMLSELVLYQLRPGAGNAQALHRSRLGA